MRIISEFRDYYDVVQATGQDLNMLYFRKAVEEQLTIREYPFPYMDWWSRDDMSLDQFIVGFCGKIYPILKLIGQYKYATGFPSAMCFNIEDVDHFVEENYTAKKIDEYRSRKKKRWMMSSLWVRKEFEKFFTTCQEQQNNFSQFFIDHNCPIFIATYGRIPSIIYNGRLEPLRFFKLFDTFRAYQEIAMYFGGMAQPNRPIPDISDQDMIIAKGFDEYSFRKPKSSKKSRS